MIIAVDTSGRVELQDSDNFRALAIRDGLGKGPAALAAALDGIATLTADEKATWISQTALVGLLPSEPTPQWRADFDRMIAFARKHGWVDDAANAVRAHIELADRAAPSSQR